MKKVVIAFIAGALLMASGQVMAETISKVGKKVGGEATVVLNGKQLSNAIIVDAKSYAPVRDIAEAFGADVGFEGATEEAKAVIKLITTTDGSVMPDAHKLIILKEQKTKIEEELTSYENGIIEFKKQNAELEEKIAKTTQEWAKDIHRASIDSNNTWITENEKKITELKAQLTEINSQIAELESAQ